MTQQFKATLTPKQQFKVSYCQGPPGPPGPAASQTPWTQSIDAANHDLNNVRNITASSQISAPYLNIIDLTPPKSWTFFGDAGNLNLSYYGSTLFGFTGVDPFGMSVTGDLGVAGSINIVDIYNLGYTFKINGVPIGGAAQTPWLSNIDGGGHSLSGVTDIDITGQYKVNGVPLATGGNQTPWTSDIDAAGHDLSNVNNLSINANLQMQDQTVAGPSGQWIVWGSSGALNIQYGGNNLFSISANSPPQLSFGGNINVAYGYNFTIGGVPIGSGSQTPWTSDIDAGGFQLYNVGIITTNAHINVRGIQMPDVWSTYAWNMSLDNMGGNWTVRRTDTWVNLLQVDPSGNVNIPTGAEYRVNGVPIGGGGGGGSQTPWLSAIDGGGFGLYNVESIDATWFNGSINTTWMYITDPGISFQWGVGTSGGVLKFQRNTDWLTVLGLDGNTGRVGVLNGAPAYPLDVTGDVNTTGVYRVNGAPFAPGLDVRVNSTPYGASTILNMIAGTNITLGTSFSAGVMNLTINAAQTPWSTNIDGGAKNLSNVNILTAVRHITATLPAGNNVPFFATGSDGAGSIAFGFNQAGVNSYLTYYGPSHGAAVPKRGNFNIECGTGFCVVTNSSNVRVYVTQAGLVGIGLGAASPAYQLDVGGDINGSANLRLPGLPSTAPAAGAKTLWYDPADGNRVKYAA
ncbi:MAG TPA: hypothetical protein VFV58_39480 [Blastocatellia bacterium]|jgi:hypothetical protein|nr:hypothetical protein [Blastocatellia bacterium]